MQREESNLCLAFWMPTPPLGVSDFLCYHYTTLQTGCGGWIWTNDFRLMRPARTTWLLYPTINGRQFEDIPRSDGLTRIGITRKDTLPHYLARLAGFEPATNWLTVNCATAAPQPNETGAGCGIRTHDLPLTRRLLYHWANPANFKTY